MGWAHPRLLSQTDFPGGIEFHEVASIPVSPSMAQTSTVRFSRPGCGQPETTSASTAHFVLRAASVAPSTHTSGPAVCYVCVPPAISMSCRFVLAGLPHQGYASSTAAGAPEAWSAAMSSWLLTALRACAGNRNKGTDNRNKGTDNRLKGTENQSKGTDSRSKGTDHRDKDYRMMHRNEGMDT